MQEERKKGREGNSVAAVPPPWPPSRGRRCAARCGGAARRGRRSRRPGHSRKSDEMRRVFRWFGNDLSGCRYRNTQSKTGRAGVLRRRLDCSTYGRVGAIAQLVERLHGMQEVRGSNPRSSTVRAPGRSSSLPAPSGLGPVLCPHARLPPCGGRAFLLSGLLSAGLAVRRVSANANARAGLSPAPVGSPPARIAGGRLVPVHKSYQEAGGLRRWWRRKSMKRE